MGVTFFLKENVDTNPHVNATERFLLFNRFAKVAVNSWLRVARPWMRNCPFTGFVVAVVRELPPGFVDLRLRMKPAEAESGYLGIPFPRFHPKSGQNDDSNRVRVRAAVHYAARMLVLICKLVEQMVAVPATQIAIPLPGV